MGTASGAMALAAALVLGVGTTHSAQAQTFMVLHNFMGGTDGAYPRGGVIRDSAGNLYGATEVGGGNGCLKGGGCGTVFKIDTSGTETLLHSFSSPDEGHNPYGDLFQDASGTLYGTTLGGGSNGCWGGCGTVFKVDTSGTFSVVYSFATGKNGREPTGGLIQDKAGSFYGTTFYGGSMGIGVVFKLDTTGKERVLHRFNSGKDGAYPSGGVILDSAGNLYGVDWGSGRSNQGVLYKLSKGGTLTALYQFKGGADGELPYGRVVRDAKGNFYGTTSAGGAYGYGVVFKVSKNRKERVLYAFTGGTDGASPFAGLILDIAGNLYGTTELGGSSGLGVVFKIDTSGSETVLHSFVGADGKLPAADLIQDASGTLYGTTWQGGSGGYGTVWKLTP